MDPRPLLFAICLVPLLVDCTGTLPRSDTNDPSNPLPDLFIKRISYRSLGSSNRIRPRATRPSIAYEFRVQIENGGNSTVADPFYLSFTTSQDDYSANIYSKHELLNDSRRLIPPGQNITFVINADIEFSPRAPTFFTIRFNVNPESGTTTTGLAHVLQEHNYRNNIYELSMRISTR